MESIAASFLFVLGLAYGSFLNVCVYRVPRKMSLLRPPSRCTECGAQIKFYDNVPVLSYFLLKGKCRACRRPISLQYPLVELAVAFLFLASYLRFDLDLKLPLALFFVFILLLCGLIDLEWKIIPNAVIYPSLGLSFVLLALDGWLQPGFFPLTGPPSTLSSLSGFLTGGGLLLLVAFLSPVLFKKEGMGGGDIKLAAFMGVFLGWHVLVALFFGFLLGSLAGIVLIVQKKKRSEETISFGPFLALGGLIALFFGEPILQLYLLTWQ